MILRDIYIYSYNLQLMDKILELKLVFRCNFTHSRTPKTTSNTSPLKNGAWKTTFLLGLSLFSGDKGHNNSSWWFQPI